MNKSIFLTLALIACAATLQAQQLQSLNSPAPDSRFIPGISGNNTSLGSIYSPSLFDGSANIGIPIYDYSNEYGNFGISISYNTKGITLDETSGPVGTHWSLNAGGTLNRVCKDLPDDVYAEYTNTIAGQQRLLGRLRHYGQTTQPSNEYWDGENDDYTVSAGSLQFTFKLGKNGYIFTHPQRRVKVELTYNNAIYTQSTIPTNAFTDGYGFRITDEQGNQYYFNKGDINTQTFDAGNNGTQSLTFDYIASWYLDKVVFANGQQITYEYTTTTPYDFTLYLSTYHKERSNGTEVAPSISLGFVPVSTVFSQYTTLTAIHYPNNITASFEFDQTPPTNGTGCSKSIKQVTITSGSSCLHYRFNKAYQLSTFYGGSLAEMPFDNSCDINDPIKRLILKGIDIVSCDNSTVEPYYTFDYSQVRLPRRVSGQRDFFGYNNANPNNSAFNTVPLHQNPFTGATSGQIMDVTTDVNALSAGNLYRVNNAYGGSVTFTYELHSGLVNTIDNLPTDPLFMGKDANDGLRLKSITESDKYHPGNNRITSYTYSGGQRFLSGGYYSYPSAKDANGNITEYTILNSPISPHQFVNGSNHGYSNVTSEVKDDAGNLLSRTETNFSNFKDNGQLRYLLNGSTKNYYDLPFTDKQYIKDWELGLPQIVTQYDQNGNLVSRTTNTYGSVLDIASTQGLETNVKTMRVAPPDNQAVNPLTLAVIATDSYLPYTGQSQLTKTVLEKYLNSAQLIADTVKYDYDDHNNLWHTYTRNSRGQYSYTTNVYNYAVCGPNIYGGSQAGTELYNLTADGQERVVSTERWRSDGNFTGFNDRLLNASITGFRYQNGKVWTKRLHTLTVQNPVSYTSYTGMTSGGPQINPYSRVLAAYNNQSVTDFQKASEVQLFDVKGNPQETKLLDQNMYSAMVWDTATGKKLAEVSNSRFSDIAYSSFETVQYGSNFAYDPNSAVSGDAITGSKSLRLWVTNYGNTLTGSQNLQSGKSYTLTFWVKGAAPGVYVGSTNVPLPASVLQSGVWNYYSVTFTAPSALPVHITGTADNSFLDEVRLFPATAQMQNWTYIPLFGTGTATDPTGRIIYYEYDKLGRATVLRDQEGNVRSKTEYHIGQ